MLYKHTMNEMVDGVLISGHYVEQASMRKIGVSGFELLSLASDHNVLPKNEDDQTLIHFEANNEIHVIRRFEDNRAAAVTAYPVTRINDDSFKGNKLGRTKQTFNRGKDMKAARAMFESAALDHAEKGLTDRCFTFTLEGKMREVKL